MSDSIDKIRQEGIGQDVSGNGFSLVCRGTTHLPAEPGNPPSSRALQEYLVEKKNEAEDMIQDNIDWLAENLPPQ